jgi:hypothetical protein
MNMTVYDRDATIERLVVLMRATAAHELTDDMSIGGSTELRVLRITSRTMRAFLVEVEDSFDHQWDMDTPDDVFRSFESMADHLIATRRKQETA